MIDFFNNNSKKIKLCFSLILIIYLYNKVNLQNFIFYLSEIDIFFLFFSSLMLIPDTLFLYIKQKKILSNFNKQVFPIKVLHILNLSRLYSMPLPSALGTQLISFIQLSKYVSNKWLYFFLSLFERINFVLVIILISLLTILIYKDQINIFPNFLNQYYFLLYFLFLIIFTLLLLPHKIINILYAFKIKKKKLNDLNIIIKKINFNFTTISFLWYLFYFLRIYLLLLSTDIHLNYSTILLIISTNLLIQCIPISAGGLGLRELTFSYFFSILNYPFEKGIIVGNILFLQLLIFSFFIFIITSFFYKKK